MTSSTIIQHNLDQQLMRAIKSGNAEAMRAALAAGANPARLADNPFLAGEQLMTGLHYAAGTASPEVLAWLLQAVPPGTTLDMEDPRGNTPLHASIHAPDPDMNFALLCSAGADPGHANRKGMAPRVTFERKHHRHPPRDLETCPTLGPRGLDFPVPRPGMQEEG